MRTSRRRATPARPSRRTAPRRPTTRLSVPRNNRSTLHRLPQIISPRREPLLRPPARRNRQPACLAERQWWRQSIRRSPPRRSPPLRLRRHNFLIPKPCAPLPRWGRTGRRSRRGPPPRRTRARRRERSMLPSRSPSPRRRPRVRRVRLSSRRLPNSNLARSYQRGQRPKPRRLRPSRSRPRRPRVGELPANPSGACLRGSPEGLWLGNKGCTFSATMQR